MSPGKAYFPWDDSLLCGVRVIDEQHRELFGEVNNLLEAAERQQGHKVIGHFLAYIERYVETHFAAEEELMRLLDVQEDVDEHRLQHRIFAGKMKELALLSNYSVAAISEACETIIGWFTHHIPLYDHALARDMQSLS